jgi:hypothetical protein
MHCNFQLSVSLYAHIHILMPWYPCFLHLLVIFFQYSMTHALGRVREKYAILMIALD